MSILRPIIPYFVPQIDGITGATLKFSEVVSGIYDLSYGWHSVGLAAKEVICIVAPNHIQVPVVFLAGIAAAAPVTLANPLFTPDELRRHIMDSQSSWIVCHPLCVPSVQAASKDLEDIKGIYVLGDSAIGDLQPITSLYKDAPDDWKQRQGLEGNDVVHIVYSSGTTGLPKGVELTSSNWLAVLSVDGRKEYFDVTNKDTSLIILPLFHGFGMAMCLTSLCYGLQAVVLPRFIPESFLKAIHSYKVTLVPLVPPLAIFLAKHDAVTKFDLTCVSNIVCGAAPLSRDIQELLSERLGGVRVRQGFGLTETTLATFSSETNLPGAVGAVTAHCEAKIVDMKTGNSLGPGEDGEICIRGPLVMKGYLNNKAATEDMIDSKGWLHTGDVGHYDENGIFFIVDRIKELIKYKGFQVAPAELEGLLLTHDDIADAGVIGIPDEIAGEIPKAYIVPKPGKIIVPEDLINWVAGKTAPHKHLRGGVEFLEAIPRSPAGKILRGDLRKLLNV
ncbi:hypothetical protein SK128_021687 [Halocaridina rubra]|uniref:Acetyl-CoA synthetase-like protein n=1 Tax=Halocaridina rubra TaxID=373956 RepID=A0AAN8ZSS8_HALRR